MKLLCYSGGKPQSAENGIGGGALGLPLDPFLDPRQPLGGLMNIVSLGDVGDGLEQLFQAFVASARQCRNQRRGTAARHTSRGAVSSQLCHAAAFPCGVPPAVVAVGNLGLNPRHCPNG
jgi:hypothetical protein